MSNNLSDRSQFKQVHTVTSFLDTPFGRKATKKLGGCEFKRLIFKDPDVQWCSKPLIEPATRERQYCAIVGTAFDYLLRLHFAIERNIKEEQLVAEMAIEIIKSRGISINIDRFEKAVEIRNVAKQKRKISSKAIESCVDLAILDPIFRVGYFNDYDPRTRKTMSKELSKLLDLYIKSSLSNLLDKKIKLNPSIDSELFLV